MPNEQRPAKKTTTELMEAIQEALESKNYYFTAHAVDRVKLRTVEKIHVIKILESKTKFHEAKKDSFSEKFRTWNYSLRGTSIDDVDIRIILSFDEEDMLIVTVINLSL